MIKYDLIIPSKFLLCTNISRKKIEIAGCAGEDLTFVTMNVIHGNPKLLHYYKI